jgi:hypothetical protein
MKHACHLPIIYTVPVIPTVHSTLILTCMRHAFSPYCNMHVVLTCTTHDYNIHITGMFGYSTRLGKHACAVAVSATNMHMLHMIS